MTHVQVPSGVRAPAALPEPGHPQLPALQDHVQGRAEQDQAPHQDKVRPWSNHPIIARSQSEYYTVY